MGELDHLKKLSRKYNPLDESGAPPEIAVTRLMTPEQAAAAPKGPCVAEPPAKHVTYRCGHRELIARFASGDCPECRAKRRREKAQRRQADRDAKKDTPASDVFRFPAGSEFGPVTWDGAKWIATLSVPGGGQFHATGTAVEKVLRGLKEQYLASRRPPAPEANP